MMKLLLASALVLAAPADGAAVMEGAAAPEELVVTLRPKAEVRHSPVLLADVADLSGSDERLAQARRLELGPAPVESRPRRITPGGILLAARLAGFDLDRAHIVGAPETEVSAHWNQLATSSLQGAAERFVRDEMKQLGQNVIVVPGLAPDPVSLLDGAGDPRFEFSFIGKPHGGGQVQVKVSVFQGSTLVGERVASFRARFFGAQMRLLTNVARGAGVTPSQLIAFQGEMTGVTGTPVLSANDIAGLVALRDIAAGVVLVVEQFESPLLVNRGDAVRLILKEGALRIVATGVASKSGRRGETIPVVNATTQRIVTAQLVEKQSDGSVVALVQ